jgi:hypothetical protein
VCPGLLIKIFDNTRRCMLIILPEFCLVAARQSSQVCLPRACSLYMAGTRRGCLTWRGTPTPRGYLRQYPKTTCCSAGKWCVPAGAVALHPY